LPNILLEAMASGLPIACSNYEPMPSVLLDGGVYFAPESPDDITRTLADFINDPSRRERMAQRSYELATHYSWKDCAKSTFSFLMDIYSRS
jgi:glycosyltransferase involved in cell wall biosynthesis